MIIEKNTKKLGIPDPPSHYLGNFPKFTIFFDSLPQGWLGLQEMYCACPLLVFVCVPMQMSRKAIYGRQKRDKTAAPQIKAAGSM